MWSVSVDISLLWSIFRKKLRGIERIPSEIFTRISGLVIILIAVIKLFI